MLGLPDIVRAKAVAVGATDWLEQLPDLVETLRNHWGISVGDAFPDATEAFVAAATLDDGTPAVLKLVVPRDRAAKDEITVLRVADGRGCVRLLRADDDVGALLVERLGAPMSACGLDIADRLAILCDLAARIWRPTPNSGLRTGAEKARWLTGFITDRWGALGRPCSERAVDQALRCATRREAAHDDERAVLVHGDVHQWNALRAGSGFALIDPDGLHAEAEYDLGVLMREDPDDLLGTDSRDRARWLAARTALDPLRIWEWGVVERVSTGLLCTELGLQPVGRTMLTVADQVAAREPSWEAD